MVNSLLANIGRVTVTTDAYLLIHNHLTLNLTLTLTWMYQKNFIHVAEFPSVSVNPKVTVSIFYERMCF